MLRLYSDNYWIYLDSTFNKNGILIRTGYDTVKYINTHIAPDSIMLWKRQNADTSYYNLPTYSWLYSTDSAVYEFSPGQLLPVDKIYSFKKYYYPNSDTLLIPLYAPTDYISGRLIIRKHNKVDTDAGTFTDCLSFEFINTPGIKVMDYIEYYAYGKGIVKKTTTQYSTSPPFNQISTVTRRTLFAYHVE